MKAYKVTIVETLKMTVEVWASSKQQAEQMAHDGWKNERYILDGDSFSGVTFQAKLARVMPEPER